VFSRAVIGPSKKSTLTAIQPGNSQGICCHWPTALKHKNSIDHLDIAAFFDATKLTI
jgi:hypothetical protein